MDWRDFNGPGKPITEVQIKGLLARHGVNLCFGDLGWDPDHLAQAWDILMNLEAGRETWELVRCCRGPVRGEVRFVRSTATVDRGAIKWKWKQVIWDGSEWSDVA